MGSKKRETKNSTFNYFQSFGSKQPPGPLSPKEPTMEVSLEQAITELWLMVYKTCNGMGVKFRNMRN